MDRNIVPNGTVFPHFLTDEVLPLVSGDEWKLIHFGAVACLRVDRGDDAVSIGQFAQGTGLSEGTVRECMAFLCDTAQIFLRQDRPRKPHVFHLNTEMSQAQLDLLEQRRRSLSGETTDVADPADTLEGESRGEVTPAATARAANPRGRGAGPFPEHPTVDITLGGDDQPVARRLHQTLPPAEWAAFEHLQRHYPRAKRESDESEAWGLFRLWQTYGFACLNNVLQNGQVGTSLGDVNRACLLAEINKLYEQEIGLPTPGSNEALARLADEYPSLSGWQDAFRLAIKLNKRRLSTVETILKNERIKAMEEAQRPAPPVRRAARAAKAASGTAAPAGQEN